MLATFSIAGRLLLCAAVWVAPSRVAIQHAHAHGDEPHTHGSHGDPHVSSDCHNHDDCHSGDGHSHRHPHETQTHEAVASIAPVTAHIHVWLLGFQLTLPLMPGSESEEQGSQGILVSLGESEFLQAESSSSNDRQLRDCLSVVLLSDTGFVRSDQCLRSADKRPSSPPLCDTARHERSGVQLI